MQNTIFKQPSNHSTNTAVRTNNSHNSNNNNNKNYHHTTTTDSNSNLTSTCTHYKSNNNKNSTNCNQTLNSDNSVNKNNYSSFFQPNKTMNPNHNNRKWESNHHKVYNSSNPVHSNNHHQQHHENQHDTPHQQNFNENNKSNTVIHHHKTNCNSKADSVERPKSSSSSHQNKSPHPPNAWFSNKNSTLNSQFSSNHQPHHQTHSNSQTKSSHQNQNYLSTQNNKNNYSSHMSKNSSNYRYDGASNSNNPSSYFKNYEKNKNYLPNNCDPNAAYPTDTSYSHHYSNNSYKNSNQNANQNYGTSQYGTHHNSSGSHQNTSSTHITIKSPHQQTTETHNLKKTLRFLIPAKAAGAIIGKGGQNIRELRDQFKAHISIPDTKAPERLVKITMNDKESMLTIVEKIIRSLKEDIIKLRKAKATLKQNQLAHRLNSSLNSSTLSEDFFSANSDNITEMKLLIHQSQAGAIIGPKGQNVKKIKEELNTKINIHTEMCPKSTEKVVQIVGTVENITQAVSRIMVILEEFPAKGNIFAYDPYNCDKNLDYGGYGNLASYGYDNYSSYVPKNAGNAEKKFRPKSPRYQKQVSEKSETLEVTDQMNDLKISNSPSGIPIPPPQPSKCPPLFRQNTSYYIENSEQPSYHGTTYYPTPDFYSQNSTTSNNGLFTCNLQNQQSIDCASANSFNPNAMQIPTIQNFIYNNTATAAAANVITHTNAAPATIDSNTATNLPMPITSFNETATSQISSMPMSGSHQMAPASMPVANLDDDYFQQFSTNSIQSFTSMASQQTKNSQNQNIDEGLTESTLSLATNACHPAGYLNSAGYYSQAHDMSQLLDPTLTASQNGQIFINPELNAYSMDQSQEGQAMSQNASLHQNFNAPPTCSSHQINATSRSQISNNSIMTPISPSTSNSIKESGKEDQPTLKPVETDPASLNENTPLEPPCLDKKHISISENNLNFSPDLDSPHSNSNNSTSGVSTGHTGPAKGKHLSNSGTVNGGIHLQETPAGNIYYNEIDSNTVNLTQPALVQNIYHQFSPYPVYPAQMYSVPTIFYPGQTYMVNNQVPIINNYIHSNPVDIGLLQTTVDKNNDYLIEKMNSKTDTLEKTEEPKVEA